MDKLKTILTLVAVILLALVLLATIGFFYTALQYLFLICLAGLATVIAVRFWLKPHPRQIDSTDPGGELKKIERTLEEYRRKLK
jgi:4-hydroxybenzoate polyprenyltransferase